MESGDSSETPPRRIKSVRTASDILETIQHRSEPTFGEIVDSVGVSKGTVHTYLETLRDEALVVKSEGTYRLGFRCLTMGESVRNQTALYHAGREEVENLAERTGEWVHLTVEYEGREVTVYESSGDRAVGADYHLQTRESPQHLHRTATGKAMLAAFDENRVRDIIDERGLAEQTAATITDEEELIAELERASEQGYAVNDEEELRGMRSVGTVIRTPEADVRGAISVTAPTSRLSGEDFQTEMPELVMQAANIIEVNLQTSEMKKDE